MKIKVAVLTLSILLAAAVSAGADAKAVTDEAADKPAVQKQETKGADRASKEPKKAQAQDAAKPSAKDEAKKKTADKEMRAQASKPERAKAESGAETQADPPDVAAPLATSAAAPAPAQRAEPITTADDRGGYEFPIGRLAASVVFVAGLMAAVYYYFRRFMGKRGLMPSREKHLQVLSTVPLGMKSSLVLVDVLGERFLVGVSDGKVELLSRVDRKAETVRRADGGAEHAGPYGSFGERLWESMERDEPLPASAVSLKEKFERMKAVL